MATYFTDFAGNSVGAAPPTGWTARWDATTLWDVVAGPYVQWTTDNASSRQDGLSWDTPGSISGDCQIAVLCRSTFATGSQCGAIIHASTSAVSGYAVCLASVGDELAVTRLDAGSETLLTGGSFAWTSDTDYWIRVERTGNTIRARAWADGGSEPGTWAFSNTDATYTTGVIGLFARNLNGDKIFKAVGVGTAGDAAPLTGGAATPTITNAGDEDYLDGETSISITGTNFGAAQGAGKVWISPTDNVSDAQRVEQTVTAWGDTSITFTAVRGILGRGASYLFVVNDGAASNAAGYAVTFNARQMQYNWPHQILARY